MGAVKTKSAAKSVMGVGEEEDDIMAEYREMTSHQTYKYIVIDFKQGPGLGTDVLHKGPPYSGLEDLLDDLATEKCCCAVYNVDYKTEAGEEMLRPIFITWTPKKSSNKFLAKAEALQQELGITVAFTVKHAQEINMDTIVKKLQSQS